MVNCQLCNDAFENQQKLKDHFESVHDIKKSDKYTQNGGIKLPEWENSEDNYNENKVKCQLCSAEFLNQEILKRHFESVHDLKVLLQCQICSEEFNEQKFLKKHFEYFHDVPVLPEMDKDESSMKFNANDKIEPIIEKVHKGTKKLSKCYFCEEVFLKKRSLKHHIDIVHEGKKSLKFRDKIKIILDKRINEVKNDGDKHDFKAFDEYESIFEESYVGPKQQKQKEAEDKNAPKIECKICVALFDSHKDFYYDMDVSFKNPEVSTLNIKPQKSLIILWYICSNGITRNI